MSQYEVAGEHYCYVQIERKAEPRAGAMEDVMEEQYIYHVTASSIGPRSGVAVAEDTEPSIVFSAPPEFQGQSGQWTPEQFFLAGVAGCYINTFARMAGLSKLEFLLLEVGADGIVKKGDGGWRFTQVNLRPQLKIAREKDRERASRLLEKAGKNCLIIRSIACRSLVEPEIVVEEELLERQKMGNSIPIS